MFNLIEGRQNVEAERQPGDDKTKEELNWQSCGEMHWRLSPRQVQEEVHGEEDIQKSRSISENFHASQADADHLSANTSIHSP